jgi:hypothetical protein
VRVGFLSADLTRWDQALRETGVRPAVLGLPFFEDERPLRGAAGLCDWRLGGRLSRLLGAAGAARVRGAFAERLLMPCGPRLPWERLVLFGLGSSAGFDEARARESARELLATLRQMLPAREDGGEPPVVALVPPGRSVGALSARQALEVLLEEANAVFDREPVTAAAQLLIVESAAGQKEAAEVARRMGAIESSGPIRAN